MFFLFQVVEECNVNLSHSGCGLEIDGRSLALVSERLGHRSAFFGGYWSLFAGNEALGSAHGTQNQRGS
jgi:hypothetical protein